MADQIEIFRVDFGDTTQSIERLKVELKETRKLFEAAKPNTAEFVKYSAEVKRLDSSIKTLNGTTKDQVNALGGINKAAKFAEGSYGELKQRIDDQKRALLELTVGSEEFNATQQGLIKLQEQRIEIESKIPSLFQERIKLAVDESNSLKQLRLDLKAAQSAALNGDGEAAQRVAELRDQIDDLRDSTRTFQGSGIERLNSSVDLLTQGFANLDLQNIQTGFRGIGAAMSAIPLVLLIEGIKALIENFDEVVKFVKEFTGSFSPAEQAVKDLTAATEADTVANNNLIFSYDQEIALLEAKGGQEAKLTELKKKKIAVEIVEAENQIRLNSAKAADVLINESLYESTEKILAQFFGGTTLAAQANLKIAKDKKESIKDEQEAIQEANKKIAESKTALAVLDIQETNRVSKANEEALKKQKDEYEKTQKELTESLEERVKKEFEEIEKANQFVIDSEYKAAQIQIELEKNILAEFEKARQKEISDEVFRAQTKLLQAQTSGTEYLSVQLELLNAQKKQELENTEITEDQKAEIRERYRQLEIDANQRALSNNLQSAATYSNSLGELSDAVFQVRRSNLEKGTEEDKRAAKNQFDVNKGFSIASALISGAVAVINASASVPYLPVGLAASIAAATATTAAVAKIASTKFQYFDGGFTGNGDPTKESYSMGNAQFHNDEYVVPSKVKNRPEAQPHITMLERMRTGMGKSISGITGFFDGGFTSRVVSQDAISTNDFQTSLNQAIANLPTPIVRVTDINKVQDSNLKAISVSGL